CAGSRNVHVKRPFASAFRNITSLGTSHLRRSLSLALFGDSIGPAMASAIVLLVSLVALSLRYPDIRRAAGNAVVAEIRRMSLFVTFTLRERLSEKSLRTLPVRRWSKPPARPVNIGPS